MSQFPTQPLYAQSTGPGAGGQYHAPSPHGAAAPPLPPRPAGGTPTQHHQQYQPAAGFSNTPVPAAYPPPPKTHYVPPPQGHVPPHQRPSHQAKPFGASSVQKWANKAGAALGNKIEGLLQQQAGYSQGPRPAAGNHPQQGTYPPPQGPPGSYPPPRR